MINKEILVLKKSDNEIVATISENKEFVKEGYKVYLNYGVTYDAPQGIIICKGSEIIASINDKVKASTEEYEIRLSKYFFN